MLLRILPLAAEPAVRLPSLPADAFGPAAGPKRRRWSEELRPVSRRNRVRRLAPVPSPLRAAATSSRSAPGSIRRQAGAARSAVNLVDLDAGKAR
jgi:hypothetical protein